MESFIFVSFIVFSLFGMTWSKNSFLNIIVKFTLIMLSVWSGYLLFGSPDLFSHLLHVSN